MANYMRSGGPFGTPGTPNFAANHLTTLVAPNGQQITVNKAMAAPFGGFLSDLSDSGYKLGDLQSYGHRNIRGSDTTLSQHAYGNAVDVNPSANGMYYGGNPFTDPAGTHTDLPPNIADMAGQWGLQWGGSWANRKDPMHFEGTAAALNPVTQSLGGLGNLASAVNNIDLGPNYSPGAVSKDYDLSAPDSTNFPGALANAQPMSRKAQIPGALGYSDMGDSVGALNNLSNIRGLSVPAGASDNGDQGPDSIDASLGGLANVADAGGHEETRGERLNGYMGGYGKNIAGGLIGAGLGGPLGAVVGAVAPSIVSGIKSWMNSAPSGAPGTADALNGLAGVANALPDAQPQPQHFSLLSALGLRSPQDDSSSGGLTAPAGYGGAQSQFAPSFSWSNLLGPTQNPNGGFSASGSYVAPGYSGSGGGHSIY